MATSFFQQPNICTAGFRSPCGITRSVVLQFFSLVIEQENDEDFYKKISVDDMAKAIFVLENWLELAHFLDTERLVDG